MLNCIRKPIKTLSKIKISEDFVSHPPKPEKLIEKTAEYMAGLKLEPIYVDKGYNLIDGYCTYLIAATLGGKKVKIIQVREEKSR